MRILSLLLLIILIFFIVFTCGRGSEKSKSVEISKTESVVDEDKGEVPKIKPSIDKKSKKTSKSDSKSENIEKSDDGKSKSSLLSKKCTEDEKVSIHSYAYRDQNLIELTKNELPLCTTDIGYGAFRGNKLTAVTIPASVVTIEAYAFERNKLVTLAFEQSANITTIKEDAFKDNQLTAVMIPKSVMTIGEKAFRNNKITELTFESSSRLTAIGQNAFSENKLTKLMLPESITKIDTGAFSKNQLTTITIPKNVTTLGNDVFHENTKLTEVILSSMLYHALKDADGGLDRVFPHTVIRYKDYKGNLLQ